MINASEVYGLKLSLIDYLIIFLASIVQWVLSGA